MNQTMVIYQSHCKKLKSDGLANEELNDYNNFRDLFSKYEFEQILKEKKKRANKRCRTSQKFIEIFKLRQVLNSKCYIVFGTITLNDKNLNKKEDTYIRKIHKWLKDHFLYSILNKDYGSKTEREHYHFIGLTTEEIEYTGKKSKKGYKIYELVNKNYTMGFEPTLCIIDLDKNDKKQTINYLLKLNNHSNKITTKNRVRIIKSNQYRCLSMLTGFEATKAEKVAKKQILELV